MLKEAFSPSANSWCRHPKVNWDCIEVSRGLKLCPPKNTFTSGSQSRLDFSVLCISFLKTIHAVANCMNDVLSSLALSSSECVVKLLFIRQAIEGNFFSCSA